MDGAGGGRDDDGERDGEPGGGPATATHAGALPTPRARVKSATLWGAVGALAFLALAQGYALVVGPLPVGVLGLLPIAALVGVAVSGIAYQTEHRLRAKRRV
ncbi:hypothetical protein GCM10027435_10570 [Haloparvum alkalitolerans]|uniref:hypothetical protein n=1 Tax=Haloparvum alkalitolerans TaxID=1042953 RepID=UPI003CFA8DD3